MAGRSTTMTTINSTMSGTSSIGCRVPLWGRSGRDLAYQRIFGLELYVDGERREMKVPSLGSWYAVTIRINTERIETKASVDGSQLIDQILLFA